VALLYAGSGRRLRQGVKELKGEGGLLLGLGHRREKRLEIEDDRWGPRSVRGREREGTGSVKLRWVAGSFRYWAERFPRSPIHFYFVCFFSLFLFLDFCLSFERVLLFRFERI
jgi:hypothetical protein